MACRLQARCPRIPNLERELTVKAEPVAFFTSFAFAQRSHRLPYLFHSIGTLVY